MSILRRLLIAFVVGLPGSPGLSQQQVAETDFSRDVRPILDAHCIKCHGPDKQRGGLRLDRRADALKGGDSGAAILPGKSAESLLLKKVTNKDANERMPPSGDGLTAAQIRTLTAWINAGAKWPDDTREDTPHWAFSAVKRPPIPLPRDMSARTDIDHFILAKLRDRGLSLSPEADRRTLIRRLKFDLLGLPPTPEEVAEFLADRSPDAYEKLVEKYLASPHYGERWARHWLDVVRFAESHGFEMNRPRPNAWPYRDWVIRSLNEDKPYDRFVREQLVGDQLGADAATGFLVGGAWDAVKSPDVSLTLQQRADELHDMISTTGSAFLGLTLGCARCHAHKFDPIPQVDYYRIKAVFAGVQHGERPLRNTGAAMLAVQREELRARLSSLEAQLAALEPLADPGETELRRGAVNTKLNTERFRPVRAKFIRFVVFETNDGTEPCIDELEVFTTGPSPVNVAAASMGAKAHSSGDYIGSPEKHQLPYLIDGVYGNGRSWISNRPGRARVEIEFKQDAEIERVVWARDRQEKYADRLAVRYRVDASIDGATWFVIASSDDRQPYRKEGAALPPSSGGFFERTARQRLTLAANEIRVALGEKNSEAMVYAGRFTAPEPTHRLHRGDPMQKRELIGPGVLAELGPKLDIPENTTDAQRREAFARWVTDPANPLTARVIVNRLWQFHFGVGIVDTPSDIGRNGGKPSHPELLDWLSAELVEKAWSLKHIHRLIVLSAVYCQSSIANPQGLAKDAQSRLLWRYPPRRLEAEPLRDAILSVSGKLDLRMGGPGFDLFEPNENYVKVYTAKTKFGPAEFRRMIYQQKPRMQLDDTFGVFDCPDAGQIAPRRNVSTTPLQALNLLNSPFALQQAGYFAERVEREVGADVSRRVKRVFALAFQRLPTEQEQTAAEKLVSEHGLAALCRAVLNANEFLFVD